MALLSPSFLFGLVVLLYLLSFVLFAVIRIATGISIQRIGYLSLRRICYTPRDGIRVDVRSLGLHLHRPTFSRPTWLSLRINDLRVTLDFESADHDENGTLDHDDGRVESNKESDKTCKRTATGEPRSRTWRRLTRAKEKIKALHGKIHWLRMIDVEFLNSSCTVANVGTVQVASLTAVIDTRRKTVDRGRLFRHKKIPAQEQRPAEWIFVMKGLLFTAEGKESLEVLDIFSLNVHGLLYNNLAGLRDASVSLKLGRAHLPYDDIVSSIAHIRSIFSSKSPPGHGQEDQGISLTDMIGECNEPGGHDTSIIQTVSDSREFVSSLLRGIQEIQLAISFIGISKRIDNVRPSGQPIFLNFAMNEIGVDLFKLDSKSPAHRMYFSSKDVAHQALLAAISIGVSIDNGSGELERVLYVPMATTTIKTTLPSKTLADVTDQDAEERNANMLFANFVLTSPSVDVDLKYISIVLALLQRRTTTVKTTSGDRRHHLLSRLLPKSSVKISIQEPVARVVLPSQEAGPKESGDYDMLISSISFIALDLESSHSSAGELHYALTASLRISSYKFYYHGANNDRHDLLLLDALELKTQLEATPTVSVSVVGNIESLSAHMVRSEISAGVHQIMQQLANDVAPDLTLRDPATKKSSFLRRLPPWLLHIRLRGSDFAVEVAGVDEGVSDDLRGVALQVESWSTEYQSHKHEPRETIRAHMPGSSTMGRQEAFAVVPAPPATSSTLSSITDGRRVMVHLHGFKSFVVEGIDVWDPDPFISVPKFEVTASTSGDSRGLICHTITHVKSLFMQYSLYRYYAIGVAQSVIRQAFARDLLGATTPRPDVSETSLADQNSAQYTDMVERFTTDVKVNMLQLKAAMPKDPSMMMHVYGFEAGHHRWATPFAKSRVVRLYAEAPRLESAWARLLSLKHMRVDLRQSRRKLRDTYVQEKSVDISTEFARLAVPHQFIVHNVFDNIVNVFKATEQLNHRFSTGTDEYVLNKSPERPKDVPRISFRTRSFMFELEDGSFDWKLGLIYRVGLSEQKQRLAREEAFRVKVKKLGEQSMRRDSSRYRPQLFSQKSRGRSKVPTLPVMSERNPSANAGRQERRSRSRSDQRGRQMRYDAEGISGLTGTARISAQEAWLKLQKHNASSWRTRIGYAMKYQSSSMRDVRSGSWGNDDLPDIIEDPETILSIPARPGLMTALITDFHIVVDKPSFPVAEYPRFLHNVGKDIPFDMEYSLLIPMNLQINMGEARLTLRNYPLPLLHVPAIKSGQSTRLPSLSLKTDFVIAEEFRDQQSLKHVHVEVVPAKKIANPPEISNGFCIDVRRTVSPVKTYSDVNISINTNNPTIITWGTSYQPAIQEMMQIVESFTKPQVDPSDRVGFWDKIRLDLHSRVRVAWKGDGDVHLRLKGSRDPYVVTGYGAGFVMCFRGDVRWDIHQDNDPKKFMTVSCGDYLLAIPDYSSHARQSSRGSSRGDDTSSSNEGQRRNATFKKVIMKLSGNVRWLAGLVFERDLDNGGRSIESIPHYNVKLKTPQNAKAEGELPYDAFRGFRSQHIHLSVAVIAPVNRDWSVTNLEPSLGYNSMHMTPRFFTHFFDWWSLFSGAMSLPIRQGKLFPGVEKSSKKFGRHLATIKYNLLLSPFFISHIYKHKDKEDYSKDTVGATGLKLRIDSFMLDLHQRREEFAAPGNGRLKMTRTSGMRINKAQLDFISADIRAVSAMITGTSAEDLNRATDEEIQSYLDQSSSSPDVSKFTIPDNDLNWIDMDDFVELDWILPAETHPAIRIMPLAHAPRFTYFRQTDHNGIVSGDVYRSSHFGDESTHFCIMSQDNDPRRVQCDLIRKRIRVLEEQLENYRQSSGQREPRNGGLSSYSERGMRDDNDLPARECHIIQEKKSLLSALLDRLTTEMKNGNPGVSRRKTASSSDQDSASGAEMLGIDERNGSEPSQLNELASDFNNRFIIHNVQLKWNNSLRNIILRYVHQVSQRRGFVYYMSRRAVKFILDIVEEQQRLREQRSDGQSKQNTPMTQSSPSTSSRDEHADLDLEKRIKEILNDGKNFVDANDPHQSQRPSRRVSTAIGNGISEAFAAQNSYHLRLIAPQIQLQSEKNSKSVLLVTAHSMQLKVIQIMDKSRLADDVSGLVQRRFSLDMESVQFFVTNQKMLRRYLHLYSANKYGSTANSAWPPWAPLEVNFDFSSSPFGWQRVVQKTSASLRYDKYNTLRLKYNDEVSKESPGESRTLDDAESRIDHLWVEFPHIRAICDSSQYYAMYLIVLDLLLYSEPLEKVRNERLEKIMLAADFSDLTGSPEMVINLQERIRQLEEIKGHFQLHSSFLDRQGWHDRLTIDEDLANCEDELFFMMKAITTSQRRYDDRTVDSAGTGLLRWYLSASEIVWHLMRDKNEPLMEIQLKHAAYDRTDNSDGSNYNVMEVERIRGLNLLPHALYPEMIAPFFEDDQRLPGRGDDIKMFKVQWHMLEAIAGIPVLDQFEVNMFPLKISLEREIGKKLFEYIFPGDTEDGGASPFLVRNMPPSQENDDDSTTSAELPSTPRSSNQDTGESRASTRPGSLEIRLKPTLELGQPRRKSRSPIRSKHPANLNGESSSRRLKLFGNQTRSKSATPAKHSRAQASANSSLLRSSLQKNSEESLRSLSRPTPDISSADLSSLASTADRHRRFGLTRRESKDGSTDKEKTSDDLTEMMSRASNYMTLAYVKIPSVVLCLSYKGRGERNIEDVHDFVFRMPALEYRNKTWSNLDLALRLKRDVMKALISHTGAIIGNKFSHHRPTRRQQSRDRAAVIHNPFPQGADGTNGASAGAMTSFRNDSDRDREGRSSSAAAFIAGWGTQIARPHSARSNPDSMISPRNKGINNQSASSVSGQPNTPTS